MRDDAVHGDEVEVTLEVAHEAEDLLRAMLKSEFAIANEFAWEKQVRVRGMRLGFELVPADRARDEGAAVAPAASASVPAAPRPGS